MFEGVENTLWNALVDPHRRAVLDLLAQGELSVGELVERLGLTQPQTSKHLRVLRDAGLVRVEQRAYRRLWNARLDRLGAHLDKEN